MARMNERGDTTPRPGTLMMTKFKNAVARLDPSLDASTIKNIRINGQPRGCSGFIVNPANGKIVYVNTEQGSQNRGALYRTAKTTKDYTGGHNNFADNDDLAQKVVELLS